MFGAHRATVGHHPRGQEPVGFQRFLARYPRIRSRDRYPELYQTTNYSRGNPYFRVQTPARFSPQETFPRNIVSNRIRPPVRMVPGSSSHQPVRNFPIPHIHSELITRVDLESDSSEEEEESDSTEEHMNTSMSSTDETSSAPGDQGQGNIAVEVIPPVAPQLELDEEELPPRLERNQNRLPRANPMNRLQAFWSAREGQNIRISESFTRPAPKCGVFI